MFKSINGLPWCCLYWSCPDHYHVYDHLPCLLMLQQILRALSAFFSYIILAFSGICLKSPIRSNPDTRIDIKCDRYHNWISQACTNLTACEFYKLPESIKSRIWSICESPTTYRLKNASFNPYPELIYLRNGISAFSFMWAAQVSTRYTSAGHGFAFSKPLARPVLPKTITLNFWPAKYSWCK